MKHEEIIEELKHVSAVTETQKDAISRACRFLRDAMQESIKQPQPFKIEVGGEYQTRDGKEAVILIKVNDWFIGYAIENDGSSNPHQWSIEGNSYFEDDCFDLGPKPKKTLEFTEWMKSGNGDAVWFVNEDNHSVWDDNILNRNVKSYTQYLNNFKS